MLKGTGPYEKTDTGNRGGGNDGGDGIGGRFSGRPDGGRWSYEDIVRLRRQPGRIRDGFFADGAAVDKMRAELERPDHGMEAMAIFIFFVSEYGAIRGPGDADAVGRLTGGGGSGVG